jgi:hypothetical protein
LSDKVHTKLLHLIKTFGVVSHFPVKQECETNFIVEGVSNMLATNSDGLGVVAVFVFRPLVTVDD